MGKFKMPKTKSAGAAAGASAGASPGVMGASPGVMGASSGGGGIMNSGIFGLFSTTVHCKSEDSTIYCSLAKIINMILMVFILLVIVFIVYKIFTYFTSGQKVGGLGYHTDENNKMTGGYIIGSRRRQSKNKSKTK